MNSELDRGHPAAPEVPSLCLSGLPSSAGNWDSPSFFLMRFSVIQGLTEDYSWGDSLSVALRKLLQKSRGGVYLIF